MWSTCLCECALVLYIYIYIYIYPVILCRAREQENPGRAPYQPALFRGNLRLQALHSLQLYPRCLTGCSESFWKCKEKSRLCCTTRHTQNWYSIFSQFSECSIYDSIIVNQMAIIHVITTSQKAVLCRLQFSAQTLF